MTVHLAADRAVLLHAGVLAAARGQPVVSDYAVLSLARVMVLAVYAIGYNILFGYAGLLSLGHAMFFAAGLYGAGLSARFSHSAPRGRSCSASAPGSSSPSRSA